MSAKRSVTLEGSKRLQTTLTKLVKRIGGKRHVKVGFLAGATYPAKPGKQGTNAATVALMNEFGTAKAPARSFFRSMIAKKSPTWGRALEKQAKASNYDGEKTLARMGEGIKGQLQGSINELREPALAESTIKRKGHSKPLIETAFMLRSVDFQVLDGDGS